MSNKSVSSPLPTSTVDSRPFFLYIQFLPTTKYLCILSPPPQVNVKSIYAIINAHRVETMISSIKVFDLELLASGEFQETNISSSATGWVKFKDCLDRKPCVVLFEPYCSLELTQGTARQA